MAASTDLHLGIGVDTRDFARFAKALRAAEPEIRKLLVLQLRAVGEIVAAEARAAIGGSRTIPATIKVRVSGATVSVVAGGAGVPLAGLLELGNMGNRGAAGATFRHPVFGNKSVWVEQSTHPFLAPAVRGKMDEVERAAVEALDEAIGLVLKDG